MGLSLDEMDQLDEGMILDMIAESINDMHNDEYQELATQEDFDNF